MKKTIITTALCSAFAACSFAEVVYIDKATPSGPNLPSYPQDTSWQPIETSSVAPPPDPIVLPPLMITEAFKKAYSAQGRPALTVYFNRELSGDVRERIIGGINAENHRISDHTNLLKSKGQETLGARRNPLHKTRVFSEQDLWAIETVFSTAYLDAEVDLVDADLNQRAVDFQKKDPINFEMKKLRNLEMLALGLNIDVLIEIVLIAAPDKPMGFEFIVRAKNVKNSRLLASCTSDDPRYIIASDEGGVYRSDMALLMAVHLSEKLTQYWDRSSY